MSSSLPSGRVPVISQIVRRAFSTVATARARACMAPSLRISAVAATMAGGGLGVVGPTPWHGASGSWSMRMQADGLGRVGWLGLGLGLPSSSCPTTTRCGRNYDGQPRAAQAVHLPRTGLARCLPRDWSAARDRPETSLPPLLPVVPVGVLRLVDAWTRWVRPERRMLTTMYENLADHPVRRRLSSIFRIKKTNQINL